MRHQESKKIAKEKKRGNRLSRDLMIAGVLWMVFCIFSDLIAKKMAWQYQPWYGREQISLFLFGLALAVIGWRARR